MGHNIAAINYLKKCFYSTCTHSLNNCTHSLNNKSGLHFIKKKAQSAKSMHHHHPTKSLANSCHMLYPCRVGGAHWTQRKLSQVMWLAETINVSDLISCYDQMQQQRHTVHFQHLLQSHVYHSNYWQCKLVENGFHYSQQSELKESHSDKIF